MEDLNLTETEMRYFGDLFVCCDEESNGKIPILKATELFRSSNIPNNILCQIMEISVAPNNYATLKHMNRKQFYSALKLIAAHQTNMTIKPELISTPLDLPLPRFTWELSTVGNSDLIQLSNSPKEQYLPKRERNFGNLGAYEPIRLSSNLSDSDLPQALSHDATEGVSTDSEIESETMSQRSGSCGRRGKTGSPWSTASESPTPTNSVAERVHPVWEHSATGRGVWPTNTAEEHTRLLGTEEESSDRHSSEEEGEGEEGATGGAALWAVSEAQARHYAAQFAQLRPERGLLSGHTARMFFEKSRLSVADLRKIWTNMTDDTIAAV
ncbi:PREDICTED: ralBP1-associated Eps domain-containing protein 1 [Papilio polytes]|uniref:ralBP1-associated Eps domain-containing protein 1 n=1 Tax=Papilio polytes TaxID=76194 RepID=UPI0006769E16|nr:PREDICTED: ralBP1-associated Eps domain-containing protein 1 [Papilio polytes]